MADPLNAGTNFYPQRGDPLGLPSAWVRDTADTNVWRHKQQASGSSPNGPFPLPSASIIVLVQNNSGANRQQGEILGISGLVLAAPTTAPTDPQTSSFFYNPPLAGVKPTTASHFGNFVVCIDPIPTGQFGRCCLAGLCAVQVNFINATDGFADVTNNDSTQLTTSPIGSASIIYSPAATGKGLALAIIGGQTNGLAMVELSQNGGVAGTNKTTTCTFTYDVKPLGGGTKFNSSALGPKNANQRVPLLQYTAGTLGTVYIDASNSNALTISQVIDETPASYGCS